MCKLLVLNKKKHIILHGMNNIKIVIIFSWRSTPVQARKS